MQIQQYMTLKRQEGLCSNTIRKHHVLLNSAIALAVRYEFVYAAIGWQPQELKESYYDGALDVIRELARHPKVVAIG